MPNRSRRSVLAACGWLLSAVLAGCGGSGLLQSERAVVDETVTVPEGSYRHWQFSVTEDREFLLSATVDEGPNVDLLLLSDDGFENYTEGREFEYYFESGLDVRDGWSEGTLSPGVYVLVCDNTVSGTARPPQDGKSSPSTVAVRATVS